MEITRRCISLAPLVLLLVGCDKAVTVKVVSAVWGSPGTPVDVSAKIQSQLDAGQTVLANNDPLGVKTDPAPFKRKSLDLTLKVNEKTLTFKIPEDGTISLR